MSFILIYVTASSKDEAKKISHHLLSKRLIACANIFDGVTSIYRWESKVQEESESVLMCKTSEAKFDQVKSEIEKIHSYSTPCVGKIPIEFNKNYVEWLSAQLV
ncbi:MAG TPA: divalent-cation tolerance protein CutA [Candidatus Nanoarchaeia archaeon]|nr:divalent-cation tolerance protein CutA [Candidatus Nanoarchaeia archaeon]